MQTQYWQIVEDCLVEFYALSPTEASNKVNYYVSLGQKQTGEKFNKIYDTEPFYAAQILMGAKHHKPTNKENKKYTAILDKYITKLA